MGPISGLMRQPLRHSRLGGLILATPILIVVTYFLLRSGYRAAFAGNDAASKTVSAQIEASKRENCAKVFSFYSARTQQLMRQGGPFPRPKVTEEEAIKTYCHFAEQGELPDYLPSKVRLIKGSDQEAVVAAAYKYDRFFGFFGEGESETEFVVLSENGVWKIDHSESLDPQSATNLNENAMALLLQLYTAERDLIRASNQFSQNFALIQQQLPGYRFPPIHAGIAHSQSVVGHLFVQLGARTNLVCLSTRSETGTLVMIKIDQSTKGTASTYQYGKSIPTKCDSQALARPYYGSSSEIR